MATYQVNKKLITEYKTRFRQNQKSIFDRYHFLGFISSGTYGRVYKAFINDSTGSRFFAIKKFKPEKEGQDAAATGISQSATREINLCRELKHDNLISLEEVVLEEGSIYMVFDYAEHDFQQIIHHHAYTLRTPLPEKMIKSLLWQLLNGVHYLHENWVMHRDLKPANLLITDQGLVKVGDLGLARSFFRPIQPLYNSDKVVVTVWYRAPELILGARHYTKAIDMWSVGCIFGEMLISRPLFKGEELRMEKRTIPFQKNQMLKIIEVLGNPTVDKWNDLQYMPDYSHMSAFKKSLFNACHVKSEAGFQLLESMLIYDPKLRITAKQALNHPYFKEEPLPSKK
ncbi:Pkinase-domain-containing protein [Neoconidiobolus thromboides FSU 785]|nr:Pkinase-domain-containing protein [Neoconidiobolus thromboides FSU 785]